MKPIGLYGFFYFFLFGLPYLSYSSVSKENISNSSRLMFCDVAVAKVQIAQVSELS